MPVFDFGSGRVDIMVGFAGPAMAGRSATFEYLRHHVRAIRRSPIRASENRGGRSIECDLELGRTLRGYGDFDVTLKLATVPDGGAGALLLDRLDGIVFVVDSTWGRIEAGVNAWGQLCRGIAERGIAPDEMPVVLQYNKRDLPEASPVGYLDFVFSRDRPVAARYSTSTATGHGIVATLDGVVKLILAKNVTARR